MTTPREGSWLQTYTGKAYWPLDPRADEVDIVDIAHALSNLCRYTGHCNRFYSVAEHSVIVSHLVDPEFALVGLLHDAAEAYCNDIARPLKRHLPEYKGVEERNWRVIAEKFGLPAVMPAEVHDADNAILYAEMEQLMGKPPIPWSLPAVVTDTTGVVIQGYAPAAAKALFLEEYAAITKTGTYRK